MARPKNDWLRLTAIGPHFLVSTLIGLYVGHKIDQKFGTDPLWTVILALCGIAAGFLNLFRELAIINRAEEEERRRLLEHDTED